MDDVKNIPQLPFLSTFQMSACLQELDCHNTLDLSFRDQRARLSRSGRPLRACILYPCTNGPRVGMGSYSGTVWVCWLTALYLVLSECTLRPWKISISPPILLTYSCNLLPLIVVLFTRVPEYHAPLNNLPK